MKYRWGWTRALLSAVFLAGLIVGYLFAATWLAYRWWGDGWYSLAFVFAVIFVPLLLVAVVADLLSSGRGN
jgi:hypothetical protein